MAVAEYRIIQQADQSFSVEITEPGALPKLGTGFATEASAQAWVVEDQKLADLDLKTDQSVAWNGRS